MFVRVYTVSPKRQELFAIRLAKFLRAFNSRLKIYILDVCFWMSKAHVDSKIYEQSMAQKNLATRLHRQHKNLDCSILMKSMLGQWLTHAMKNLTSNNSNAFSRCWFVTAGLQIRKNCLMIFLRLWTRQYRRTIQTLYQSQKQLVRMKFSEIWNTSLMEWDRLAGQFFIILFTILPNFKLE